MRANTYQTNEPDALDDGADPTDQSVEEEEKTQSNDDVREDLPVHGRDKYSTNTTAQQSMNWLCIWNLDVRRIVAYQSAREESIDGGRSGHHPGHVTNHNAAQHLSIVQCQSINSNKSIKR